MARFSLFWLGLLPVLMVAGFETTAQQVINFLNGGSNETSSLPPIILAALPHWSHLEKIAIIAEGLVNKGYEVTLVTGREFKDKVDPTGANFVDVDNHCGMFLCPPERLMSWLEMTTGPDKEIEAYSYVFAQAVPNYFSTVQRLLRKINDPRTIVIHDVSMGVLAPIRYGAPGLRPHTTIGIGLIPICQRSNYTYPLRDGKLPETGPDAQNIHWEAWENDENPVFEGVSAVMHEVYKEMGARDAGVAFPGYMTSDSDILCPLTIPSFEYDRPDLRANVEYIGVPQKPGFVDRKLPPWWDEMVQAKRDGKKIVVVSASSLDYNAEYLIMPALEAVKDKEDVFVAALFVNNDPEEWKDQIPSNTRYTKTVPMDMILEYADVIVTSAGYGTIQHALRHGVPIISNGVEQDKPITGVIIELRGVGKFHYEQESKSEGLRVSIEEVLGDPEYKKNALKMKDEYSRYDPIDRLDEIIQRRSKEFDEKTL